MDVTPSDFSGSRVSDSDVIGGILPALKRAAKDISTQASVCQLLAPVKKAKTFEGTVTGSEAPPASNFVLPPFLDSEPQPEDSNGIRVLVPDTEGTVVPETVSPARTLNQQLDSKTDEDNTSGEASDDENGTPSIIRTTEITMEDRIMYVQENPRRFYSTDKTEGHLGCMTFEEKSSAWWWCKLKITQAKSTLEWHGTCVDPRWLEWDFVVEQCIKEVPTFAKWSWCCDKVPKILGDKLKPCRPGGGPYEYGTTAADYIAGKV